MLNDDVLQYMLINFSNLDSIISASKVNKQLNHFLTSRVQLIANHLNIIRPVINWSDLIRENSKIHATEYAKVTTRISDDDWLTDLVTRDLLLQNAIYEDRDDLVLNYLDILTPDSLIDCQSESMIIFIFHQLSTLVGTYKPNQYVNLNCLSPNGKFNDKLFRLWNAITIKRINNNLTYDDCSIVLDYIIELDYAIDMAIRDDYPINKLLDLDSINWNNLNYDNIGKNNLKILTPEGDLIKKYNNTKLLAKYFKIIRYSPPINRVLDYHDGNGDELIKYVFEDLNYPIDDQVLSIIGNNNHWPAIIYFKDKYPQILNYLYNGLVFIITKEVLDYLVQIFPLNRINELISEITIFIGDINGGKNDSPELVQYMDKIGIKLNNYDYLIASCILKDNIRTAAYVMKLSNIPYNTWSKYNFNMTNCTRDRITERLQYYSNL